MGSCFKYRVLDFLVDRIRSAYADQGSSHLDFFKLTLIFTSRRKLVLSNVSANSRVTTSVGFDSLLDPSYNHPSPAANFKNWMIWVKISTWAVGECITCKHVKYFLGIKKYKAKPQFVRGLLSPSQCTRRGLFDKIIKIVTKLN